MGTEYPKECRYQYRRSAYYICSTIKKIGLKLLISNVHGLVKSIVKFTKPTGYLPIIDNTLEAVKAVTD